MKLTEYYQLTLEERIARERARAIFSPKASQPSKEYTLEDYYAIGDVVCSLERLRNYQLADILGKYKIF